MKIKDHSHIAFSVVEIFCECMCAATAFNVSDPLSMDERFNTEQLGINYASPSSGILPETGTALVIKLTSIINYILT